MDPIYDAHAEDYERQLSSMTSVFDGDVSYFASYKVRILAERFPTAQKILDFGCGIGRSLPFLHASFPGADIWGLDPSRKSLAMAARRSPETKLIESLNSAPKNLDLIFLTGVLHHLPEAEVPEIFVMLREHVRPGGSVAVFEHNPFNPLVRYLVWRSEYDADAVLYSKSRASGVLQEAGFTGIESQYCLFFPSFFKSLRPFENRLGFLPLGGQYFVIGTK